MSLVISPVKSRLFANMAKFKSGYYLAGTSANCPEIEVHFLDNLIAPQGA